MVRVWDAVFVSFSIFITITTRVIIWVFLVLIKFPRLQLQHHRLDNDMDLLSYAQFFSLSKVLCDHRSFYHIHVSVDANRFNKGLCLNPYSMKESPKILTTWQCCHIEVKKIVSVDSFDYLIYLLLNNIFVFQLLV